PRDVAHSLATTRATLDRRAAVVADGRDSLLKGLAALADGTPDPAVRQAGATPGGLAFLFTGQGAQRPGMGDGLYAAFPVYARAFDAACAALDAHLDRPLRQVVSGEAELLDRTRYTQAGLFALEVALYRLFESWGVRPDFLLGHSVGELAAAHVAGVLSLPDAATLVAARGRLMDALPEGGAMVSVEAAEDEVRALLTAGADIAAVNGPRAVVVSGPQDAVTRTAGLLEAAGHRTKRLNVSHAFHSSLMEPMLAEFGRVARTLTYRRPSLPVVSNVTGRTADPAELATPAYWVRHVRAAVRFHDGMRHLEAQGVRRFVELGPSGVLTAAGRACVTGPDPASEPRAGPDVGPDLRSDAHAGPVVRADSDRGCGAGPHRGAHTRSDVRPEPCSDVHGRCDVRPDAGLHGGPHPRADADADADADSDVRTGLAAGPVAEPHVLVGPDCHARSDGEPVHVRADPRAGSDAAPHPRTAHLRAPRGAIGAAQAPDRVPGGADHSNVWVRRRAGRRLLARPPGPYSRSRDSPFRGRYGRATGAFLEHQCQPAAQMEDTVHPEPAPAPCRLGFEQRRRISPAAAVRIRGGRGRVRVRDARCPP
ncbi:acyltransferase domain-containing protein, partial [Streptomyces sp. WAC07061]|uniref:acyltransferase domain-containing protein n=1 Tax=Streptomyces sp. WAC07061 TaxID=2487410 RepID=UPI00163C9B3A